MSLERTESYIGDDTGAVVEFDYSPPQRQTQTDPAWDAEIEITAVLVGSDNVMGDLNQKCLDRLEQACRDEMNRTPEDEL